MMTATPNLFLYHFINNLQFFVQTRSCFEKFLNFCSQNWLHLFQFSLDQQLDGGDVGLCIYYLCFRQIIPNQSKKNHEFCGDQEFRKLRKCFLILLLHYCLFDFFSQHQDQRYLNYSYTLYFQRGKRLQRRQLC